MNQLASITTPHAPALVAASVPVLPIVSWNSSPPTSGTPIRAAVYARVAVGFFDWLAAKA
jgi:hypothetical protein